MRDGRERRQRKRCCRSSSISSLLSGPWATRLPQSATAPPSPEHRIRYAQRRQICFNSPLTPRAPQLSKSGLNKLRGARQTKKNTNAQRRLLWIRRSLCLPGEAEKPTRLSSLHDTGEEKWRHKNLRGKDDSMYEYAFIHAEQKCGCWSRLLRTMTSLFHYYFLIHATIQHQKLHVLLLSNCLNTKHSDIWRHCYRGIPPGVDGTQCIWIVTLPLFKLHSVTSWTWICSCSHLVFLS